MGTIKILQVVGYKNSGKTTLIARWVRLLKQQGLSVAVIKHHGHGGSPEIADERTDTRKFLDEGAQLTIVAGGGVTQMIRQEELRLEQLIRHAQSIQPDVILIEGYKHEVGPKVVLVRDEADWPSLSQIQGIKLIVGNLPVAQVQSRKNEEVLDQWFLNWLRKEDEREIF